MRLSVFLCLLFLPFFAHAIDVQEVKTSSGLTAWLVQDKHLPLISIRIAFKDAGYAYDPKGKEGRADMVSELLFEGAGEMNGLSFMQALEDKAIRLNADIEEDLFTVSMQTLSENKEEAFRLMGLMLNQPRFDKDAIERIRAQSVSNLKQLAQSPNYVMARTWQKTAYGEHPYANPKNGTDGSIAKLSKSDFVDYMKRYLSRSNILIAVAGDITPEELNTLLDKTIGTLPINYTPDVTVSDITLPKIKEPVLQHFNVPQTIVGFGTQGIKRSDPYYFDAYVMNYILGGSGSLTSRLGQAIREERGLSYYVSSSLDPMRHGAVWGGSFATRNDQASEAVKVFRDTIKTFVEKGITEEELKDAKQYITGSFSISLDRNVEIANYLISMQLNNLGQDYLNQRNNLVNAVTKQGVEKQAKEMLDSDALLLIMVGEPKGMDNAPATSTH